MTVFARLAAAGLASTLVVATPAAAAAILFEFDLAESSVIVTSNDPTCFPSSGCALSARLLTPLPSFTLGAGESQTFDFARFTVSPGIGIELDGRVQAVLAFTTPASGPASSGGTASYFRFGGMAVGGTLIWDTPSQQLTTSEGSVFTVSFANLAGLTKGKSVDAPVTITVNSVAAVPEPASWAMMIGGFALVGGAVRRRRGVRIAHV